MALNRGSRRGVLAQGLGAGLALAAAPPAQGQPQAPPQAQAQPRPLVVAAFSILGDFVAQVAGPAVTLRVLLGPEADPHEVSPRPSDAVALRQAALVVRNGLGLEPWLDRLLRAAPPRGRVLTASDGWPALIANGVADPHAWLDPAAARHYVRGIGAALAAALPAQAAPLQAATAAYLTRLEALEAWVLAQVAGVAPERRVFVTGHPGFAYFAARFGLRALATPPQAWGGQGAGQLAALVNQVRGGQVRALFSTGPEDATLMGRVAAEAGVPLRGRLYAETLSAPDGPAATYEALVRHNTGLLVAAMAG